MGPMGLLFDFETPHPMCEVMGTISNLNAKALGFSFCDYGISCDV